MTATIIPTGPSGPRTLSTAARVAVNRGHDGASIMLINGTTFDFAIREVLEDGLIGSRGGAGDKVCLIMFTAIALIEFG